MGREVNIFFAPPSGQSFPHRTSNRTIICICRPPDTRATGLLGNGVVSFQTSRLFPNVPNCSRYMFHHKAYFLQLAVFVNN
jgi:hypothetical protein